MGPHDPDCGIRTKGICDCAQSQVIPEAPLALTIEDIIQYYGAPASMEPHDPGCGIRTDGICDCSQSQITAGVRAMEAGAVIPSIEIAPEDMAMRLIACEQNILMLTDAVQRLDEVVLGLTKITSGIGKIVETLAATTPRPGGIIRP